MTEPLAGSRTRRVWTSPDDQGATFVELFFDLVFVFAITSVTSSVLHHLDWTGVGRGVIVLWLVWWAWTQFTWTLNPADTDVREVRLITLAGTAAAFFMAQAIPDAFGDGGTWFAVAYVLVRLLGLGLQFGTLGHDERTEASVVGWIAGSSVGLVLVLAGGIVDTPWREVLWIGAILFDVISALRAAKGSWFIRAGHFAERHGLIVIIALGESLIAAGVALGDVERDLSFAIGTIAAVLTVCALWWLYFSGPSDAMEEHLASLGPDEAGGAARNIYSWAHLPIVAGIIALAVGIEQVLAHPADPLATEGVVAIVAGVAMYLGAIAYGVQASSEQSMAPWLVGIVAIGALVVVSQIGSGLVTLVALTVGLAAFAAWRTPRRAGEEARA